MHALEKTGHACALQFRRRMLGTVERVLVEEVGILTTSNDGASRLACGRADRYFEIHFEARGILDKGDLARVRIDRATPAHTHGMQVEGLSREICLPVLPA